MTERIDRTEPVRVEIAESAQDARPAGYPVAEAICRYFVVGDGWWGQLSDVRPAGSLATEAYWLCFADGRRARVRVTAFPPRDRRKAYFVGVGPSPASSC